MTRDNELTIIHCDMDAFYAAVEQRDNPSLRGKPVIVGGQPGSRGVVATCSYEARKFGIRSAMPLARAYHLCPQAVFLPVDMKHYREASRQVFTILEQYTPLVEPLSIDEAFLDVTGCLSLFGSVENIAQQIKQQVHRETGLTISVGISYNKFLAKLATDLGKPDGLKSIRRSEVTEILSPLPVSRLWGAGPKTCQSLARLGITTIGQLRETAVEVLKNHLGASGILLWQLAHGHDPRPVEPHREIKSMGKETTFPHDTDDYEYLEQVILEFSRTVARRLRQAGMEARTITLKIRYHDFHTITRSRTLDTSTSSDTVIYQTATDLLHKLDRSRGSIRLIGVSASNLQNADSWQQGSLFATTTPQQKQLEKVLDQINHRFGENTITRASLLLLSPADSGS
jgi:DNA polymerase-4